MDFYKILIQTKISEKPFYEQTNLKNLFIGNSGYSLGIKYSPDEYNKMLSNDYLFNIFVNKSVKQVLMSNNKFLSVIAKQNTFDLELVDCKIKDNELDDLLSEEEDILDIHTLNNILGDNNYEIAQIYFRTKGNNMITLKSNGVIGIDSELISSESINVKKLIDFLGFGSLVKIND